MICLAVILSVGANDTFAQKKTELYTAVFNAHIHCQDCVKKIENNLSVLGKGVKDVDVNLKEQKVVVVYDAKQTTKEKIAANFKKIGTEVKYKSQTPYKEPTKSNKKK